MRFDVLLFLLQTLQDVILHRLIISLNFDLIQPAVYKKISKFIDCLTQNAKFGYLDIFTLLDLAVL